MLKDLVHQVRAASWRSAAEVDSFVAACEPEPAEVLQVLDLLLHRTFAADAERHALRRQAFLGLVSKKPDDSLFRPLVRAFKAAAPDVRATIAQALPRLPPGDVGELAELLRAPEADVRQPAARALAEIGGKPVIVALVALVSERNFAGLREAVDVLVKIGGAQALPVLERLAQHPDAQDRLLALRYLGDEKLVGRSTGAALRLLSALVRDSNEQVAALAVAATAGIASEAEYHAVTDFLLDGKNVKLAVVVLEGLKRFPTELTAEVLERKLASGPNALRFAALNVLEHTASDALIGPLVYALGHPHIAVRNRAAEVMSALSRSGKVEMGRTIVWLLRSGDVTVRRMAAEVLRSVSDPHGELWPKLLSSLRDDDWWVRERVMDALVGLAGNGLSRYMVAWLSDSSDVVRRFALTVLLRLKDPETIGVLVHTARHDPDWWAREKAVEVIAEFKDPRAIPTLVDLMQRQPDMQVACIDALATVDAVAAAAHLVPLCNSDDPDVRLAVLRVLDKVNDPAHAIAVEPLRDDGDPLVQRLALGLLSRWSLTAGDGGVGASGGGQKRLDDMLAALVRVAGEDLIVASGRPVFMKRHGDVVAVTEAALSADDVSAMLTPLLTVQHALRLDTKKDVDLSYVVKANGQRFRANIFRQRGGLSAVFRVVRSVIPGLEELGLPAAVRGFTEHPHGLVLVCGPTASGKSTTLAAILDWINRTSSKHIVSLEDPIEVVHVGKKSTINQREIGTHTRSYASGLRAALREDPDVLMIGDLRDAETLAFALTAAETGHLVFGTLHAVSCDGAIERIINAFPRAQQEQVRSSLADHLRGAVCQQLVLRKDGQGRMVAAELMLNNEAVANLIRKGKAVQIPTLLATQTALGMQTLDQDLARLHKTGLCDPDDILARAKNKKDLELLITEPTRTDAPTPALARRVGGA